MTTQKIVSSKTVKFLYSYGGKIVIRPTDGKLRYAGGFTRVLSVDRSVSYAELMVKFGESCGSSMILKCKLPTEDLDVLVSIKSDEELRFVIEEYERVSPESKIQSILFPMKHVIKKISQPSSPVSCFDFPSVSKSDVAAAYAPRHHTAPPCAEMYRYTTPVAAGAVAKNLSSRHTYNAAHPMKPVKKVSQPSSPVSCFDFPSVPKSFAVAAHTPRHYTAPRCADVYRNTTPAVGYPVAAGAIAKNLSSRNIYNAAQRIRTH